MGLTALDAAEVAGAAAAAVAAAGCCFSSFLGPTAAAAVAVEGAPPFCAIDSLVVVVVVEDWLEVWISLFLSECEGGEEVGFWLSLLAAAAAATVVSALAGAGLESFFAVAFSAGGALISMGLDSDLV